MMINTIAADHDVDQAVALKQKGDRRQNEGKLTEAVACYREAVSRNPAYAEAYNNLGIALKIQHQISEAIDCFHKALEARPAYPAACNNLANALVQQGDLITARKWYRKAIQLQPNFAEAHNNLGNVLRQTGSLDEAKAAYQAALAIRPDYAEALNNLGTALQESKDYSTAIAYYQTAISINPGHYSAYNNLGNVYQKKGLLTRAIDCYQRAIDMAPGFHQACNSLANALVDIGDIAGALTCYGKALELSPADAGTHSNLLLALQYDSDQPAVCCRLQAEKWWQRHGVAPAKSVCDNSAASRSERLKIGYVSPDFRQHSVSFFFMPLLIHHNRQRVETFCYSDVGFTDHVTEKLKDLSEHWRPITGLSATTVAEQIRADGIDILVDLAGHTAGNRLPVFACKPAPLQVTWLGYPDTTGLPVMDYRLTDEIADPPGESDRHHSETLIRLPQGFLCYGPPPDAPPASSLPASRNGYVTFGSFNNLSKVNPSVIALWSQLLQRVAGARLLLKGKQFADEQVCGRFLAMFASNGIGSERLMLLPRTPSTSGHLALYDQVDIGLDPFPYNGTTTTCEALWMGVPVITLRGDRHAGRVGASILTRVGLKELVVDDSEKYLSLGMKLAQNLDGLEELRSGLRRRMQLSALCDGKAFAQMMENTLLTAWRDCCLKNGGNQEA